MYYVKSKVQEIVKASGKRMSKGAWEALDSKILKVVSIAIKLTGHHKTITDTEILLARGGDNGRG